MGCGSAKLNKIEFVEDDFRAPPSSSRSSVEKKEVEMSANNGDTERTRRASLGTTSAKEEPNHTNEAIGSTYGPASLVPSSGISTSSDPPDPKRIPKSPQPTQLRSQTMRSDASYCCLDKPQEPISRLSIGYVESVASRCSEFQESICSDTDTESSIGTPRLPIQKRALPQRVDLEVDDPATILTEAISSQSSVIEINHHSLETLPDLLMQCSDWAQTLCVSHNALKSISPLISTFSLLTKLSVSHNCLAVLPPEIGALENLTFLDVSYNKLSFLPPTFSQLKELKTCNFDFNQFVEFPHVALEIKTLEKLFIAENHNLSSLPKLESMETGKVVVTMDNVPSLRSQYNNTYLETLGPDRMEWNNIYPDKVLDFLYIGSLRSAQTPKVYDHLSIGFVVTCGKNMQINQQGVERLELAVEDMEEQSLKPYFEELYNFIETNRRSGSILVHCFAGLSRSATMIVAYLMKANRMRLDDAMKFLVGIRPNVHPNPAFMKELIAFDADLFGKEARPLDYELLGSNRTIRRLQMASGNKVTAARAQQNPSQ